MLDRDRKRRLLLSALVVGAAALIVAMGSYSLFTETTGNSPNTFAAGVALDDNDAGQAMFSISTAESAPRCIKIKYQGAVDSEIRLYGTVSGEPASYLQLTVTRGTQARSEFPSCSSFRPDDANYIGAGAGVVYSGSLADYPTSFENGITDPPGRKASWQNLDTHVYRFELSALRANGPLGEARATFNWGAKSK